MNESTHDGAGRWDAERYRTLFELSPVAVYSCDATGVIREYNGRAVELWGREPAAGDTDERFCGSFRLFRPDGSFMPHDECPMSEVVAGVIAEARDAEVLIERPDGSRITVVVNIRPLKNERGDIAGAINCFYDITARKETEEALRDSDRRKNEFLATLAHELRSPLAPIRNSVEILRRTSIAGSSNARPAAIVGPTSDPSRHAFDTAMDVLNRQVGQMERLVDDLMDAGRISSGKMVLRVERVELSSVVYHAVESVRAISDGLQQDLVVTLPQTPVYLNADAARLAQIVGNLLSNASKFTERGGQISLTVERLEQGGGDNQSPSAAPVPSVVIRVRDTGVGMEADQLPRIFDLFEQVDTALARSTNGLGIGLTLVRTLVQMHGGTVEATSAGLGRGSEFLVRLPIMVDSPIEVAPAVARQPAAAAVPMRVLVVDDNPDAADMLATLLRLDGHETHAVHDGVEAVEATLKIQPDLILLDIGLPRLNGYEVARTIRERHEHNGCPVLVALTGWGQDNDHRRSKDAGFYAHLVKPVDEVALRALLASVGAQMQQMSR